MKKSKKKKPLSKKSTKNIEETTVIKSSRLDDDNQQNLKKKSKIRVRRTIKSRIEPIVDDLIVLTSSKLNSLKLFGTAKLPRLQTKNIITNKSDLKKKQGKVKTTAGISTTKLKSKLLPVDMNNVSANSSSSADNSPIVQRKINKKKMRTKCTKGDKN